LNGRCGSLEFEARTQLDGARLVVVCCPSKGGGSHVARNPSEVCPIHHVIKVATKFQKIFEGVSMAGTEAATDFVNDDAQLLPFLNQIKRADGTLPHFELLLESRNMGASAVRSQILAWRTTK
jgi:hypothetical protein